LLSEKRFGDRIVKTAIRVRPMKLEAMLVKGFREQSLTSRIDLSCSFLFRSIAEPV
jgi:hypothetical protein